MKLSIMAGIAVGLLAPTSAEACRINLPPQARVARDFDGVVIGVVENPVPSSQSAGERPGWDAMVRVTRIFEGRASLERYWIGRTGDSASCDDGQPMPVAGALWVVYISGNAGEATRNTVSYPLGLARRIDPRFAPRHNR